MAMPTATTLFSRVYIRWAVSRDMQEMLAIEAGSHDYPWLEEDFRRVLRHRSVIGMVADHGPRVVGMMIYELRTDDLAILDFAVDPAFRRQGVGHQMMQRLKGKLSPGRRTRLEIDVRETALAMQLFLRHEGFKAAEVLREHHGDSGEDGYRFVYEIEGEGSPSADVPTMDDGWLLD